MAFHHRQIVFVSRDRRVMGNQRKHHNAPFLNHIVFLSQRPYYPLGSLCRKPLFSTPFDQRHSSHLDQDVEFDDVHLNFVLFVVGLASVSARTGGFEAGNG